MSCAMSSPTGGGHGAGRITVCQFSNPSVVEAATPRGDFLFLTQAYPATIAVADGRPSCVLKARVGLDWLMNNRPGAS
jgi:hypothetical protein